MSYRKIIVDKQEYRYVVGPKFIKIQKDGHQFALCEISKFSVPIGSSSEPKHFATTPHVVKQRIREIEQTGKIGGRLKFSCRAHGHHDIDNFVYDPFENEIYDRHVLMVNCPECVENREDDI